MLRSSLPSVSRGLVYINILGHTCLRELIIEYEQVTTWEARFFFQQIGGKLSCVISRRLHWTAQWAGAQIAATTVWLTSNRQLEYRIIYHPPQSPQPSMDSHCIINTNDIYLLLWSNMENLKDKLLEPP